MAQTNKEALFMNSRLNLYYVKGNFSHQPFAMKLACINPLPPPLFVSKSEEPQYSSNWPIVKVLSSPCGYSSSHFSQILHRTVTCARLNNIAQIMITWTFLISILGQCIDLMGSGCLCLEYTVQIRCMGAKVRYR